MGKLESLRIAKPCPVSWEGMSGNDAVRHCCQCDREVYNLSGMTRKEAESLVSATEGMCVSRSASKGGSSTGTSTLRSVGLRRLFIDGDVDATFDSVATLRLNL